MSMQNQLRRYNWTCRPRAA